jgi:Tfp pilus assembly protein PilF
MQKILVLALVLLTGGCAGRRPAPVTPEASATNEASLRGGGALEGYMAEVRRRSIGARLTPAVHPLSAEAQDPRLRDALAALAQTRSASAFRQVAEEYRRLNIVDAAYDHYEAALELDRRDAAALDGLARLLRDAGTPDLALGNAVRATYFAPRSAAARNTLGTLLYALGYASEAQAAFERALALDPTAAYAANNICYVALTGGDLISARHHCRRALELAPDHAHANNNLAVALAAAGDVGAARAQFLRGANQAAAEFNLGVALAAAGRYRDATAAFETASRLRPGWTIAERRASEARRLQDGVPAHADR